MASDSWVYDGTDWQNIATWWAFDTAWRDIQEAWVFDILWRKVFEVASCETGTCTTTATTWGPNGGRFCPACSSGYCMYCIRFNWGVCDDACHNIDGYLSTNGGSYLLSNVCTSKACANDSGCDCEVGGSYDFACDLAKFCLDKTDSYQGRLNIQRDSDSGTDCLIYGGVRTGNCAI
jgi:hypothetical protein